MNFLDLVNIIFIFFLDLIYSLLFLLILSLFILIYFLIVICFLDRKKIKKIRSFQDDYNPTLKDLKALPLVNIIVPAWKENEIFRGCLQSITKLSYPNLKIVINSGGNEETINIANSFKKYEGFVILEQKKGGGKLKAINDSLAHVSKGLVYLIDADIYLNNDIFIKMLYHIINENNKVVISSLKPHRSIENKNSVKYIYINRYFKNRDKRLGSQKFISPHTCLNYEVIKSIDKLPEKQLLGDGDIIGREIINKGYDIYRIHRFVESFNYPDKLRDYFAQNTRWIENYIMTCYRKDKKRLIMIIFYLIASIYMLIFPFLIFINFSLFMIGIFLFLSFYLNKIRYYLFFKRTNKKNGFQKINFQYFLRLFYYIYLDIIINIFSIIELIFNKKKYKERKNII